MTVQELKTLFDALERDQEVYVYLFRENGTGELFDIIDVSESNSDVHIEISEVED